MKGPVLEAICTGMLVFSGLAALLIAIDYLCHRAALRKAARMPPIEDTRLVAVSIDSRCGRTFCLEAEDGELFHVRERMLCKEQREEMAVKLEGISRRESK